MQSPRLQSITARFSPRTIRTSFRRSSSASSASSRSSSSSSADERISMASSLSSSPSSSSSSQTSSPVSTINSIVFRHQKSTLDSLGDEGDERSLHILEPRPAAMFCSLEERMLSF